MTSLMHFEEKVHRKGLVCADSLPLLMPRLLFQVLKHMGFPEEPRLDDEDEVPSGHDDGASDGHAHIFYPPVAGPGGGSSP